MIRFLIHRPVSVTVVYLALCLLSIWSIRRIPVSLLPEIDIPQMTILVEQEGYSAREIENSVLQALRQRLLQVDGITRMESTAGHETGVIRLRFAYGRDIDYAFLEVNEKVDQSLDQLPEDVKRPRVVKASAGELPAFYLSLAYQEADTTGRSSLVELSEFADQVVRRRLEQLEEVALVDITGLSSRQIVIVPREDLFIKLGISQQEVQQALEAADLSLGAIQVRQRQYEYLVRLGRPLSSLEDIRETALRVGKRVFTLSELAEVRVQDQPARGMFAFNGRRGISLAVIKNSAARTETLEKAVGEVIGLVSTENPAILLEKSRDQLRLLSYSLGNLRQSLLLGALLATVIVFLFYRNWRVPAIIAIIIPLSVLLSLLFFDLCGLSIDIISLSGVILGLGLMIDNGIIVLDNISQYSEAGHSTADACIQGANEMIRPLLSSMLTTCSVFLPLILLSGLAGALFLSQALAVTIGLTISYLISITLLPVLYFVLLPNGLGAERKALLRPSLWQRIYDLGFRYTFRYPLLAAGLAGLLVGGGYLVSRKLPVRQLPEIPQTAFELYLDWNEAIRPDAAHQRVRQLFTRLSPPQPDYYAHIGLQQYLLNYDPMQQSSVVQLYVPAGSPSASKRIQYQLDSLLRALYPRTTSRFLPERTVFEQLFPAGESSLEIGLRLPAGSTETQQIAAFTDLSGALRTAFPEATVVPPVREEQLVLIPDQERLLFYGLTSDQLFAELQRSLNSRTLLRLQQGNAAVPVVISGGGGDLDQLLRELQLQTPDGHRIPVHQLLRREKQQSLKQVHASRNGAYLPVRIKGLEPEPVIRFLAQYQQQHPRVNFELSGPFFENRRLLEELLWVLGVSLLLLFFIMAAQFESILQPLIILLEIPVSLSGSLLALYLGGASLNVMAFIGMVVTAGIVINDSIIKIDTINRLRRTGQYSIRKAIHEGGLRRLNPIIMTSLTSVLAVVPFLWGGDLGASLQRPLALALIGGMTIGTMVSLWLIPLVYAFIYRDEGVGNE